MNSERTLYLLECGAMQTVTLADETYPALLRHIKRPPETLYFVGDLTLASALSVSIVGTRKATGYGLRMATKLAELLAEHGVVVTSGMALGIDSISHKGALRKDGKTIAVLGSGLDICSPPSNHRLMAEIAEKGLLLSEYPPGTPGAPFTFPQRNRIISGLSVATVIVEGGLSSGALITAERAAEQGREVYAVPGDIDRINSIGANKLIKDGALPLVVLEDLLDDLGIKRKALEKRMESLGKTEIEILRHIEQTGEVTANELCRHTKKQPAEISGILTVLEIKGMIYSHLGKIFIAS